MGQAANSNRNASLDNKKSRAAGRNTDGKAIREAAGAPPMKGKTGGAFGADNNANRTPSGFTQGGGGGGGAQSQAKDEVRDPAGRSTRPARKRVR
jgi:hypothetical protein